MRLLLCKVCEYATIQQNRRHSLIGIFDNIVAPFFPVDHPPFHVCVQLEFDRDEAGRALLVEVLFIDDDGSRLLGVRAEGQVPAEAATGDTRMMIEFMVPNLRFERPGDYRLDVLANGVKIGEERIPVLRAEPAS